MVFWLLRKLRNPETRRFTNTKMKKRICYVLIGLALTQGHQCCLLAQAGSAPSSTGGGGAQAQANATLPSIPSGPSNGAGNPAGIPEPTSGLDGVNWDGKSFKITDPRLIESKFSAYLNEPEISFEEEREYALLIDQILEILDVYKMRGESRTVLVKEIMPLLRKASKHQRDGGQCRSLYNAVGTDLQSKDASYDKKERLKELEKKVDSIKWNLRMATYSGNISQPGSKEDVEDINQRNVKYRFLSDELANTYAEMLAIRNQDVEKVGDARIALQRVVIGLFLGRKFDHVMIGSAIYKLMYADGAGEVKLQQRLVEEAAENAKKLRAATSIAETETTSTARSSGYKSDYKSKSRAESGIESMMPTVTEALGVVTAAKIKLAAAVPDTLTELEMISQESIDQCNRYVSAVKGHLAQGELQNAVERLQEAYFVGEQLSVIRSFPREYKQQLWSYLKKVKTIKAGLASKDMGKAQAAIAEVNKISSDNPFSQQESDLGNARTISAMHLAKAKEAATRGDRETMNKELEEAAKIWPQNPALAEASAKMLDQLNQQVQGKEDLKKLLEQKNFKYIMEEKARFLAVASDEPTLLEKLKNVLEQEGKALSWKARVEELLKRNDPYGAWEEAEKGIIEHPENNDLMKLRSDAAVKCPEFVDKIEKARIAIGRQDPTAALAAYLTARQIYPQSSLSREGIDSLSKQLLSK
jgi:hypothetical protein